MKLQTLLRSFPRKRVSRLTAPSERILGPRFRGDERRLVRTVYTAGVFALLAAPAMAQPSVENFYRGQTRGSAPLTTTMVASWSHRGHPADSTPSRGFLHVI